MHRFSTLPAAARLGQLGATAAIGRTTPAPDPNIMDDDAAARAKAARESCPFLTAKQTAFHLGIARSTLKAMRLAGKGPRCRRHGRTWRYHIDDIEAWSAANARGSDHG
ncbi:MULTISPECIES: helix-turn-helix transcriptional regulator [Sphingomonas]|jgi:hypothetical protein|uniref:helix-turn-helix transcriptional regulator n=2 Tax=Sphingomonas TaxID=13687 RepID=UPI000A411326|nr:helix-turn-helix domain-containing protein [Sphingomonas koreensis]